MKRKNFIIFLIVVTILPALISVGTSVIVVNMITPNMTNEVTNVPNTNTANEVANAPNTENESIDVINIDATPNETRKVMPRPQNGNRMERSGIIPVECIYNVEGIEVLLTADEYEDFVYGHSESEKVKTAYANAIRAIERANEENAFELYLPDLSFYVEENGMARWVGFLLSDVKLDEPDHFFVILEDNSLYHYYGEEVNYIDNEVDALCHWLKSPTLYLRKIEYGKSDGSIKSFESFSNGNVS